MDADNQCSLIECLEKETKKKESRKRPITPPAEDIQPDTQRQRQANAISSLAQNTLKMRYILHGGAGVLDIDISREDQISYTELTPNLHHNDHLSADQISNDDEKKREAEQYRPIRFNGVDMFFFQME